MKTTHIKDNIWLCEDSEVNYTDTFDPENNALIYFFRSIDNDRIYLESQFFITKDSAMYHLCTNQIEWS